MRVALAVPFAVFLIVYGPAVGHGFISDDFRWILESRVQSPAEIVDLFSRHTGFYRPAVAVTFAVDYALFGNRPLGYGVTNLLLAALCGLLLCVLLRSLGLPLPVALVGSGLWLLNLHGIAMALLWISGRTALLLVACSLAAASALVRGRLVAAAIWLLLALLAKEEAIMLPFILACWLVIGQRADVADVANVADAANRADGPANRRRVHVALWLVVSMAVAAVYLILRFRSGAFTPASAPPYYHFVFAPRAVAWHVVQYADRSMTLPAAVCLFSFLLLRPFRSGDTVSSRIVACGIVWLVGGYALTVFLPVTSSLYACFPSIGACLIAAEVCRTLWNRSTPPGRTRAAVAGIGLVIALVPVYRARNHRWLDVADFSRSILGQLRTLTAALPDNASVVLIDERAKRVNLESAFGTLVNDAHALETGRMLGLWIEPPLANAQLAGLRPPTTAPALTLRLRDGVLLPVGSDGR